MEAQTKNCQNCKKQFIVEDDDLAFYKKIDVPPPTWCPQCRFIRRMIFRNERKLFKVKEGLSGQEKLSLYPPEAGFPVYDDKEWYSQQKWDPMSYGQDFDPSRPFLLQLQELNLRVPKARSDAINMVNSDYSGNADGLKNCYLIFNANRNEDCGYGVAVDECKNCYDNSDLKKSENCYGCFWVLSCSNTFFSTLCAESRGLWFSRECRGCTDCFGCVNLRNKSYCFFNEQLTKDEYKKRIEELKLDTWTGLQSAGEKARAFWLNFPIKNLQGMLNVDVTGDFVSFSKNAHDCYLVADGKDLKYASYSQAKPMNDSMDVTVGGGTELVYEVATSGWGTVRLRFCWECWDGGQDFEYSMHCGGTAENLFGCVSLRSKQYCILNKQYSKEEYFALRKKIIEQMNTMPYVDKQGRVYRYGEFFPPEFSPFAYNQSIAPEHFPFTEAEAISFGARWQDVTSTEYKTTISADALPDAISDISDSILKEVISCSQCKKAYRIIQPELQFLRQFKIPLPRTCVDCRHYSRLADRNKAIFYDRQCMCLSKEVSAYQNIAQHVHAGQPCPNKFKTSFAPDRPDIVYCESCYNAEVV